MGEFRIKPVLFEAGGKTCSLVCDLAAMDELQDQFGSVTAALRRLGEPRVAARVLSVMTGCGDAELIVQTRHADAVLAILEAHNRALPDADECTPSDSPVIDFDGLVFDAMRALGIPEEDVWRMTLRKLTIMLHRRFGRYEDERVLSIDEVIPI